MTGTSSTRPDKSRKNNQVLSVDLLSTRLDILKENHENLVKDYTSLEEMFTHATEMYEIMKLHFETQIQRLLEDCEKERSKKEEYKKKVEEIESDRKTMIDDVMIKNQELMNSKDNEEEELKEIMKKYDEFTAKFVETEMECLEWNSLNDAKNLIGQRRNNVAFNNSEVIVVNNDVNNNVTDATVKREDIDVEYCNPPRETNIITQCSNGANSSKVILLSSDDDDDDEDDEHVLVQLPIKKFRR